MHSFITQVEVLQLLYAVLDMVHQTGIWPMGLILGDTVNLAPVLATEETMLVVRSRVHSANNLRCRR